MFVYFILYQFSFSYFFLDIVVNVYYQEHIYIYIYIYKENITSDDDKAEVEQAKTNITAGGVEV